MGLVQSSICGYPVYSTPLMKKAVFFQYTVHQWYPSVFGSKETAAEVKP
jgi:hypothetical protein